MPPKQVMVYLYRMLVLPWTVRACDRGSARHPKVAADCSSSKGQRVQHFDAMDDAFSCLRGRSASLHAACMWKMHSMLLVCYDV